MDVFEKYQANVARRTLQMTDAGAVIMGGMTKQEAREFLLKHNLYKGEIMKVDQEEENDTR